MNKKGPSRKVNELDNRGSHFYLAMYWAEALANQDKDIDLKNKFSIISEKLISNEDKILKELLDVQGDKTDIKGYYFADSNLISHQMRPSITLNSILS